MTDRACKSCVWWQSLYSLCRRNPPVYIDGDLTGRWPETEPDDWCGEYLDKDGWEKRIALEGHRLKTFRRFMFPYAADPPLCDKP